MRGPVRHAPLVTQVSDGFRSLIATGQWPVGTRIPGELDLARQLGVSRATVREALRGLSLTGLLEPRTGDGTYVRATDEISGVLVRDDLSSLDHVLDARAGLEAASARLAADRRDPAALAALDAALDVRQVAHDSGDLAAYTAADAEFHRAVVLASGNPLLARLHSAVAGVVAESIEATAGLPEVPAVMAAHARLVECVRAGDADAAAAAAYALIASVRSGDPSRP